MRMRRAIPQCATSELGCFFLSSASNTKDRIAADLAAKEIEAEIEARKQASAIIMAEQGRWYTAIIRPLLTTPFIIYLSKVIVWTRCSASGRLI